MLFLPRPRASQPNRRNGIVFLLLLSCLPLEAAPTLLVLADRSAGMGLPAAEPGGPTRLEAVRVVLTGLAATLGPEAAWGLMTFAAAPRLVLEFGAAPRELEAALAGPAPGGTSRLGPALDAAISLLAAAPGPGRRILLLMSDCLNSAAPGAPLPELAACREGRVELYVLGFDLPRNRPRAGRIRSWVLRNGGLFFDITEGKELAAALSAGPGSLATPLRRPPASPSGAAAPPPAGAGAARRARPAWLLAAAFLGGLAALAGGYRRYRGLLRRRSAREARGSPLRLELKLPDGSRRLLEAGDFPLLLSAAAGEVTASGVDGAAAEHGGLLLTAPGEEGALCCTSRGGPALLDGVARTSLRLREGSCLRLGSVLIRVRALPAPPGPAPPGPAVPPPRPLFLAWLAPLGLLLLAAFFLPGEKAPGSESPPAAAAALPAAAAAQPGGRDGPLLRETGLRQVAPGENPDFFPADILCFHAHPDDESLDFGVLLARAAAEGLRAVVVLFTDGEGGNDAYPDRPAGGSYPGRRLAGAELASLRVMESSRAQTCLGVEQYVRLGLKNHPYNRADQVMSVEATAAAWGGEEAVVRRLQALLAGFRPRLVASPAGPGSAVRHFEHQAAGYLVGRAVRAWRAAAEGRATVYLTAADPGAPPEAAQLLALPAELVPAPGAACGRDRQLLALAEYRSQRDAAVAGAARLPNFADELYRLEPMSGAGATAGALLSALKGDKHARH